MVTDQSPVEHTDQSYTVTTDLAPLWNNLSTFTGPAVGQAAQLESLCIIRVCQPVFVDTVVRIIGLDRPSFHFAWHYKIYCYLCAWQLFFLSEVHI